MRKTWEPLEKLSDPISIVTHAYPAEMLYSECPCPPQILMLKTKPQGNDFRSWGLWWLLGPEGSAHRKGISALRKEIPQASRDLSTM